MRRVTWLSLLALAGVLLTTTIVVKARTRPTNHRLEWTTSRMQGSQADAFPFELVDILEIELKEPLALKPIPGSKDLLVVQRNGDLVRVITSSVPWMFTILGPLGDAAYELELAPDFPQSGHVFVSVAKKTDSGARMEIQRIKIGPDGMSLGPQRAVIAEFPLQDLSGHIGGGLAIDGNGTLFVGSGDTGNSNGIGIAYEVSQNPNDKRGKILRFDTGQLDVRPTQVPFFPGAAPETYALGLRNPWKLLFDAKQSRLYAFDVGEDQWESIHLIQPGANHGWPLREGSHPFRGTLETPDTVLQQPFIEHSHLECRVIVGGAIYEGEQFPSLRGKLVYGDYTSGAIFVANATGENEMIALSGRQITDIELDASGELLVLSQNGRISRLQERREVRKNPIARRLSETGLFTSTAEYNLAPGVVDYEVNSPLFSDGKAKRRHMALPPGGKIDFSINHAWTFPLETVFVKTFLDDELQPPRRLETRILHLSEGRWIGYAYRWNDDQSDADLVERNGTEVQYTDNSGHEKKWQIPSQMQCVMCHTMGAHFVLGVNTAQLNRTVAQDGSSVNQLAWYESLGIFSKELPRSYRLKGLISSLEVDSFPRHAPPSDSGPLDKQAIGYLISNCSHCHCYLGGGNSKFNLISDALPEKWDVLDALPIHGSLGLEDARLIAPGHPERSVLLERMKRLDQFHMPKLGTTMLDPVGVKLVEEWIRSLP